LRDPKVDYTYIYSTIMALRFHGDQDTGAVPKERLLQSIRLLLDNPEFADQVILDLSRWEDWSVLDRLVEMFKTADKKSYVRQPVVTYLTVAMEQPGDVGKRASAALAELERADPETVKQARSLMAFGSLARAKRDSAAVNGSGEKVENSGEAQAFAASDADNETDPADIPDPAAFEDTAESSQAAPTKALSTAKPDGKTATLKTFADAASDADVAARAPRPILIVGVPLLAAAALMGVYWLVLRVGAL